MQTSLLDHLSSLSPSSTQSNKDIQPSIKQSLDELFPEQQFEEKNLKKAKEILGTLGDECSEEELKDIVTKTQYLCETWLDDFERSIFNGTTLQELLHEKGGK